MGTLKDKVYPLYKNDLNYKKETVSGILVDTIEKAKISMLLPVFFSESSQVVERLNGTEYEKCATELCHYLETHAPAISSNAERYRDADLLKLIDLFQQNSKMLCHFEDWLIEINTAQCESLAEIALLKETVEERFKMEALAQVQEEMNLNMIFIEHAKVKKGLQSMARLTHKNRNSLRWRVAARESVFTGMEAEVREQQEQHKEILEQERKAQILRANPRQFVQRELNAEEDLQLANQTYNKTCDQNLKDEYAARAERNKWQIQLQSLLRKYDTTLGDKFKEMLYLDDRFNELKAEQKIFMKVYNRAEKVYNDIVKAKEAEEHRKWWAKVVEFMENRAARIIQLWYREHLRETKPELLPKPPKKKGGKKDKKKGK